MDAVHEVCEVSRSLVVWLSLHRRKVDKDSEAGLSAGERANLSESGNDPVSNVSILHDLDLEDRGRARHIHIVALFEWSHKYSRFLMTPSH